jgi:branched-chain amino acid transport system ATP-binding protein
MAMLRVDDLSVSYGRVRALQDVSLSVGEGEIVAVLGANGAGKSTLLRTIAGAVRPTSGSVVFAGEVVTGKSVRERIDHGIVLVPEGRRILISLTIQENLLVAAHLRRDADRVRSDIASIYDRFPNLAARRDMLASCLSGGEQQMLAIGRAMMARPKLMMLDEPSLGLSPLFVQRLFELITDLNRAGLTVLLVEQNTAKALSVASHVTVLELGRVAMEGSPATLQADPLLHEAYLGRPAEEKANAG